MISSNLGNCILIFQIGIKIWLILPIQLELLLIIKKEERVKSIRKNEELCFDYCDKPIKIVWLHIWLRISLPCLFFLDTWSSILPYILMIFFSNFLCFPTLAPSFGTRTNCNPNHEPSLQKEASVPSINPCLVSSDAGDPRELRLQHNIRSWKWMIRNERRYWNNLAREKTDATEAQQKQHVHEKWGVQTSN